MEKESMENPSDLAEPTEGGAEVESTAQVTDAPEQPARKPSIFISHKRDVALDDDTAMRLAEDLGPLCEDVYLDLLMPLGVDWEALLEEKLRDSDFVIVLISAHSNEESKWVRTELTYAEHYNRTQEGRPAIIPVRLGYRELYKPRIDALIGQFQALDWNLEDYEEGLLKPLRDTLANKLPVLRRHPPGHGMGEFLVHASRKERFHAAYVEPSTLVGVSESLKEKKLLWITGDAGVRNYVALSLAIEMQRERVYEISRPRSWSEIKSSRESGSVIIFQDIVPSLYFEEKPRAELESLKDMIERGNLVILTMAEDAFPEVEQEIRKEEFAYDYHIEVGHDTYDERSKLHIFRELLQLAHRAGDITSLYDWAFELTEESSGFSPRKAREREAARDKFNEAIRKSTPAEIERFFTQHLRQVRRTSDFLRLWQRSAAGDEEVHSWFVSLDDSTRCFLLALSIFSELDGEQFWEKYKAVVQVLKKLDSGLALLPVGICRQRAAPYVTVEGPLGFVDERIADAVHEEIARNYREYFIELLPKLREWSVPPGREPRHADVTEEERKLRARDDQEVRAAVAQMVGKVGRHGLHDLKSILDYWATDPVFKIREAVAIALEQTALSSEGADYALNLLEKWSYGFSAGGQTLLRTYAAASPLGRIASAGAGRAAYPRALKQLHQLTGDGRRSVRFYASIPLKKMARRVPLSDLKELLSRAAQDDNTSTKINVAQALNEARFRNENTGEAEELFDQWAGSEDASLRWVALCSLLLGGRRARGKRGLEAQAQRKAEEVSKFLPHDAATVASVFLGTLADDHHKDTVWPLFTRLIADDWDGTKGALLSGLAQLPYNQLDKELLTPLRKAGDPRLENVVVELRREVWKQLLESPVDFLKDLRKRLNNDKTEWEVFRVLTELLKPETEGSRNKFIGALVYFYPQDRESLEEVLSKMKSMAHSVFEPVCVEVRREALKGLFYDPLAFIRIATEDLGRDEIAGETRQALESLAQEGALQNSRDDFLQALACGYELDPSPVRSLLKLLRNSGSNVLRRLAYEFKYRLLEGRLPAPAALLFALQSNANDAAEWSETLMALQNLAAHGAQGRRDALVESLAEARAADSAVMDQLLRNLSAQGRPNLAGLQFEVKVVSLRNRFSLPKAFSRFFTPK
jgi:hypothetical protein